MILQLRHTTFITQSLKEIHCGRETGLIDTGPFGNEKDEQQMIKNTIDDLTKALCTELPLTLQTLL